MTTAVRSCAAEQGNAQIFEVFLLWGGCAPSRQHSPVTFAVFMLRTAEQEHVQVFEVLPLEASCLNMRRLVLFP